MNYCGWVCCWRQFQKESTTVFTAAIQLLYSTTERGGGRSEVNWRERKRELKITIYIYACNQLKQMRSTADDFLLFWRIKHVYNCVRIDCVCVKPFINNCEESNSDIYKSIETVTKNRIFRFELRLVYVRFVTESVKIFDDAYLKMFFKRIVYNQY